MSSTYIVRVSPLEELKPVPCKIIRRILHVNKVKGIERVEKGSKFGINVKMASKELANDLIESQLLQLNGFAVSLREFLIVSIGVAHKIDVNLSEQDILDYTESPIKILSVKRFNKRTSTSAPYLLLKTETVKFTFEGNKLPGFVRLLHRKIEIKKYVHPVIQCVNCLCFGHTKNRCPERPKSYKRKDLCKHCLEVHKVMSRGCTEYIRQKLIKNFMCKKNLSFFKAVEYFPKVPENVILWLAKE